MRLCSVIVLFEALVIVVSGCEQVPTCREAMVRHYHQGGPDFQPEALEQVIEDGVDECLELHGTAVDIGCLSQHERWRQCLYHDVDWTDYSQRCHWRRAALEACLEGEPFEAQCKDGRDNDGDGYIDCFDPDCSQRCWSGWYATSVPQSGFSVPQSGQRGVDMLFVLDNSGSMAGETTPFRVNFPALTTTLKNMIGGLPNIHLGMTTTDLGDGGHGIRYCDDDGDAGALVTGNCTNPFGPAPYLIDVAPEGCEITWDAYDSCSGHDCTLSSCAHEPKAMLVEDAVTGCPRCRNYSGESLEDVFSCMGDVGTMGCGFEQPLEAMYKVLSAASSEEGGFLREDAFLAVFIVTDEDDCSASDTALFDQSATSIESPLGPLTSYRCFEFGVTCDTDDRTHVGTRHDCVPRQDSEALLHPISRYTQLLERLKDPQMLVVAAIAGPVTQSPSGLGLDMEIARNELGWPALQYTCTTAMDGGIPGIRLFNLVEAFNPEEDLGPWAYTSICSADYTRALQGFAERLRDLVEPPCPPTPFMGCSDVGVEFGEPRAAQTCVVNYRCLPSCSVGEFRYRGTQDEYSVWLPHCLEVCPEGYCEGNRSRSLAYAVGHPPDRDPDLPVDACWHLAYNPSCPSSNYAQMRIARRADPPPRTFMGYSCTGLPTDEQLCADGIDNDEDCLVDMDDPCCRNPANCDSQ